MRREIDRTWVLDDGKGSLSFRGNREAGLSGSSAGAGYFLLVKEGAGFTAVPVEEWYNFRPVARCAARACWPGMHCSVCAAPAFPCVKWMAPCYRQPRPKHSL